MNFTTHELVLLSHGLQSRIEYWDKFESDGKLMLIRPLQELNERIEAEVAQREAAEAAADYQKFLAHSQPISDGLRRALADVWEEGERRAEQAFIAILNDGGAGTEAATAAHSAWVTAKTVRATFDAQRPPVTATGQAVKFVYSDGAASWDGCHGMAY